MATCEAERRNKQAIHMLKAGMGAWVLDVASVLATLEGDGNSCSPENDERNK